MKGKFKLIILLLCLFFSVKVNALIIESENVPNNTYIIGKYMFTDEEVLTTKHIMLSAQSIDSHDLSDMIIYYKTPRGLWIDGLSGSDVEISEEIEIERSNSNSILIAPTLSMAYGGLNEEGTFQARLNIVLEGIYAEAEKLESISGVEICEVNGANCTLLDNISSFGADVELNQFDIKSYKARVYINTTEGGTSWYSPWSDELKISNIPAPTLANPISGTRDDYNILNENLNIVTVGEYGLAENIERISGMEVCKIDEENCIPLTGVLNLRVSVPVLPFETAKYKARVYINNGQGEKDVYSSWSEPFTVTNLLAPTISMPTGHYDTENKISYGDLNIYTEGIYGTLENSSKISGTELCEQIDDECIPVEPEETRPVYNISVNQFESKTYFARVYSANSNGEIEYYSPWSEPFIVSNIPAPTLANPISGIRDDYYVLYERLNIATLGVYAIPDNVNNISGVEICKVNGNNCYPVGGISLLGASVSVAPFETNTYKSRVYVNDENGKNIGYSSWSESITLSNLPAPTLSASTSGYDEITDREYVPINIVAEGAYKRLEYFNQISGLEICQVNGEECTLQEGVTNGSLNVYLNELETKTFKARVFVTDEATSTTKYSLWSEEFNVSNIQ